MSDERVLWEIDDEVLQAVLRALPSVREVRLAEVQWCTKHHDLAVDGEHDGSDCYLIDMAPPVYVEVTDG